MKPTKIVLTRKEELKARKVLKQMDKLHSGEGIYYTLTAQEVTSPENRRVINLIRKYARQNNYETALYVNVNPLLEHLHTFAIKKN